MTHRRRRRSGSETSQIFATQIETTCRARLASGCHAASPALPAIPLIGREFSAPQLSSRGEKWHFTRYSVYCPTGDTRRSAFLTEGVGNGEKISLSAWRLENTQSNKSLLRVLTHLCPPPPQNFYIWSDLVT